MSLQLLQRHDGLGIEWPVIEFNELGSWTRHLSFTLPFSCSMEPLGQPAMVWQCRVICHEWDKVFTLKKFQAVSLCNTLLLNSSSALMVATFYKVNQTL